MRYRSVVFVCFVWSHVESMPTPSSSATSASAKLSSAPALGEEMPKQSKKRRKRKLEAKTALATPTTRKSTSTARSSSKTTFLRRIHNEWKEIVASGMAFDWNKLHRPIRYQGPQHVWIGPEGKSWRIWRFSFVGPSSSSSSPYADGVYHGRIVLPATYPLRPPQIQVLTPSGRFQPATNICLSASQYHPEAWQPAAWTVLSLVLSLRLHMLTATPTEIGGLSCTYAERSQYARASRRYATATVDHAHMIQQGWMAGLEWNEADDEDEYGTEITAATLSGNKPDGVVAAVVRVAVGLATGPLAPWVLVFGILFVVLNHGGGAAVKPT